MSDAALVSEAMRGAIGGVILREVSYPITSSDIRRWAIAVYWPEPTPERYLGGDDRMVAPEEFNPFAWAVVSREPEIAETVTEADPDHVEKRLGVPGPGLSFQLFGGVAIEYGEPMRVGDQITSTTTLVGYSERDGRLGRMLMTGIESVWTNQRSEFVRRKTITLIRY